MNYDKKYSLELNEVIQKEASKLTELNKFLLDILTHNEYKELAMRWQIVKRLEKGESQRSISKELGVGIATVSRGSRQLGQSSGGFRSALKKIEKL